MSVLHLISLLVVALATLPACADDGTLRAAYSPADCPPQSDPAAQSDPIDPPDSAEGLHAEVEQTPPDVESDDEALEAPKKPTKTRSSTQPNEEETGLPLDLNAATAVELLRLPGVGPALAQRIIEYREKRRFEKVEDIQRVRGIGSSKLSELEPFLVVN